MIFLSAVVTQFNWIVGNVLPLRNNGHQRSFRSGVVGAAFLAVGSSSFDFALDRGGVGLSGVGYGLFGMLYDVLSRGDERFRDALDKRTESLFIGWFFFCIFATITHVFNVANVAHAAGAVFGVLLAYAILLRTRALVVSGIAVLLLLGFAGATVARPYVNPSSQSGYEEAKWGYDALVNNRNQEAAHWLREAVRYQPKNALFWYDLGVAYHKLNDYSQATLCLQRAHELDPKNPDHALGAGKNDGSE